MSTLQHCNTSTLFTLIFCFDIPYFGDIYLNHLLLKHVMLVDDDQDDQDFFLSVVNLVDSKVDCKTVENGLMALNYLNEKGPLPDLIFLDLNMPVMDGKQFLSEVKSRDDLKTIPIIILSTSADQATIAEALRLGASDFITKPNKLSLLELKLKEVFTNPSFFRN